MNMRHHTRFSFALMGVILALGAPLGWMGMQWSFSRVTPAEQIAAQPVLFAYLFIPTLVVFCCTGYVLGRQWEHLNEANKQLQRLASYDVLTGLSNTRRFWEDLHRHLQRANRKQEPVHLLLLDIDHFKRVNDTLGHLAGDHVLRGIGEELRNHLRVEEGAYRVGGEEFGVILADTTAEVAQQVAKRLRRAVESRNRWPAEEDEPDLELTVTISIGVASCNPGEDLSPQQFYELADQTLYHAKRGGRNRVSLAWHQIVLQSA